MKLVTFTADKKERVGAVLAATVKGGGERIVDLTAAGRWMAKKDGKSNRLEAVADMIGLLTAGRGGLAAARKALAAVARELKGAKAIPPALRNVVFEARRVRLSAPVPKPPKFICVGLNYRDHALEGGHEVPKVPTLFNKFSTSVVGPADKIVLPKIVKQPDYEGEFAFIIGKKGRNIPKSKALDYVAGYTIVNDVSARDFQKRTSQWMAGKAFDGFGVMGPALVTADEIKNPHNLDIKTIVSGKVMQSSNTKQLIFRVQDLIADISTICTLEPGDIVATGTPSGVGVYSKPQRLLKEGDVVRIEIEGLGALENTCVAEKRPARAAMAARPATKTAAAKKPAAKKPAAKKTAAKPAVTKVAAKKPAAKKVAAKKPAAKKVAAKKPAAKPAVKKVAAKKPAAKKVAAKKPAAKKVAAKKPVAKKVAAKKPARAAAR